MSTQPWYARPGIVLSLLALLIALTVLFTETRTTGRNGDSRLLSTSADPQGAKLFYQLAERMGYSTRREDTQAIPNDGKSIFAVLDPTIALEANEVHAMLQHARSGGALLVAFGSRTKLLSDSLKISVEETGHLLSTQFTGGERCATSGTFVRDGLWFGPAMLFSLKFPDSPGIAHVTFLSVMDRSERNRRDSLTVPAVIGMPYGNGRIVLASDPDVLRNDALRNCSYGLDLPMVRALQYLSDDGGAKRRNLVFDDYHLGSRLRSSSRGIVARYLIETKSGNVIFQVCIAGLVLLLAAATRVLPPRQETRLERRSPLEHVDALARAYAQVGATRTGALQLLRGLQRRVGGVRRAATRVSDDAFLIRIADSVPVVKPDVAIVRNALTNTVSEREFVEVGNAIARIEAALTKT